MTPGIIIQYNNARHHTLPREENQGGILFCIIMDKKGDSSRKQFLSASLILLTSSIFLFLQTVGKIFLPGEK